MEDWESVLWEVYCGLLRGGVRGKPYVDYYLVECDQVDGECGAQHGAPFVREEVEEFMGNICRARMPGFGKKVLCGKCPLHFSTIEEYHEQAQMMTERE